jgi:hypothetical protein
VAKQIIQNPVVIIAGGTVSANVAQATLTINSAEVDTSNFGSDNWSELIGGRKSGSLSLTWHNDYAAGGIDSIVHGLIGGTAAFEVRPSGTAAAGSSSPKYTGTVLVTEYSPIDSAVGDLATFTVTWPTTGAITRGTA